MANSWNSYNEVHWARIRIPLSHLRFLDAVSPDPWGPQLPASSPGEGVYEEEIVQSQWYTSGG